MNKNIFDYWRGGAPTVIRASIVTSSQITSFYHTKEWLLTSNFEGPVDIAASMNAGVCYHNITISYQKVVDEVDVGRVFSIESNGPGQIVFSVRPNLFMFNDVNVGST